MARNSAPTKLTGGGGFLFEDRTSAFFAVDLLAGFPTLGSRYGTVSRVDFQTRSAGWLLDDLLLTLESGESKSRAAVSVKSDDWLTTNGFRKEFAYDVAEQWNSEVFDQANDLLVLVVGRIAESVLHGWHQLVRQAIATSPEILLARLQDPKQMSELQRRLFQSLRQSPNPSSEPLAEIETARLVSRLRVLSLDFEAEPSSSEGSALRRCQATLSSNPSLQEAQRLWSRLCALASEQRPLGGYLDRSRIQELVKGDFELADPPDVSAEFALIRVAAMANASAVRETLGQDVHILRKAETDKLSTALESSSLAVVVGESGTGKTALVSGYVRTLETSRRIIWLNPVQLDHPDQYSLSQSLGVRSLLPDLMRKSQATNGLLVLDGIERIAGVARNRAVELASAAIASDGVWRIIFTSQPEGLAGLLRDLVSAGADPARLSRVELEAPSLARVRDHFKNQPGLLPLLMRPELRKVLQNLKVLDWVVLTYHIQPFVSQKTWVGESDVIEWIWQGWIGEEKKFARAGLIRELAVLEGDQLAPSIALSLIRDSGYLELLSDLESEGLLWSKDGRIGFTHELLSDWARLQALLASDQNQLESAVKYASLPRWGRAIRYYSQRLLEQGSLDDWKSAMAGLGKGAADNTLASDLFLDGILFASNAEELLDQVWTGLIADKALLHRLLKRLLFVATIPDPRYQYLIPDQADWASAAFRIPYPLYWLPILRVLSKYADSLKKVAPIAAAEVCELWLRTMPLWVEGRKEAAFLAVSIAREMQALRAERVWFTDDIDQKAYEALLYAAPEMTTEVCEIALQLANRIEESPEVSERREASIEKKAEGATHKQPVRFNPIPSFYETRNLRPQSNDGPKFRVNEGFRKAVLDTPALATLAAIKPECAREIALAVCIEEPRPVEKNEFRLLEDYGVSHWGRGFPPMYFKGPFYRFLQAAPKEGIDTIVRLVNHATERWFEGAKRHADESVTDASFVVELDLGDKAVRWVGGPDVYAWYRNAPMGAHAVICALMALEKWLYDEIDQEKSISQWIDQIFGAASSVAFAGLLTAVGLKQPMLFTGPLQPLLGNISLYDVQLELATQEDMSRKIEMSTWVQHGEQVFKIFQEFHTMFHRKILVRDVAQRLMFHDEGTQKYLIARHAEWTKLLDPQRTDQERLEFFLARFDLRNFTVTDLPDGQQIEFDWPPHLKSKAEGHLKANETSQLAHQIPLLSRRTLSEHRPLAQEALDEFLTRLQGIANEQSVTTSERLKRRLMDATAAGIAVLAVHHLDWLKGESARMEWCTNQLKSIRALPDPDSYSSHVFYETSSEAFLAEAALGFLVKHDERWIRELVFEGVTGFYYSSPMCVMQTAFGLRNSLKPGEFKGLVNLVFWWSALRLSVEFESGHHPKREDLARFKQALKGRYIDGKLKELSLARAEQIGGWLLERTRRRLHGDEYRPSGRPRPEVDVTLLKNAFAFLDEVSSVNEIEVADLKDYCRELLSVTLGYLQAQKRAEDEIEGTPYEYDRWIFERVAQVIPRCQTLEEERALWQPILMLGGAAHYWVTDFAVEWFSTGLRVSGNFDKFAITWREMLDFTLIAPEWEPNGKGRGKYYLQDMASELAGLNFGAAILKDEKYAPLLSSMAPTFERWCERWLQFSTVAGRFANFLASPSAKGLMKVGIKRLAAVVGAFGDRAWESKEIKEHLAAALWACWRNHQTDLQADATFREAFLALLNAICSKLSTDGLQLRAEVSQAIGVGK